MSITVKATQLGFYGTKLRYEGEVFEVASEKELGSWMERKDAAEPKAAKGKKDAAEPKASDQNVI